MKTLALGNATLEALLEGPADPSPSRGPIVAECVDDRHPTLVGRVLVRWSTGDATSEAWVPTLQALVVRAQDHVLLLRAENWSEPVVIGVIDGFRRRATKETVEVASMALRADERLRIEAADGVPLLDVFPSESGPVVRLLSQDVNLELPGALRVRADSIELIARRGELRAEAASDVVVKGEVIQLN